jgi:hypothetical protein
MTLSFISQDPDEVGSFRQQDLKEVACASPPGTLGPASLFVTCLLVVSVGR